MSPKAVVAGSSGFLGKAIAESLERDGFEIVRVGRRGPDARWGDADALRRAIDGAEIVVNLAGKSVNCRYTDENRAELLRSRIETTRELREAIAAGFHGTSVLRGSRLDHRVDRPDVEGRTNDCRS
jgi:NAD dependent epimerase/dehydratase family enzyme